MNPYNTHGAFSWAELQTTDPEKATQFYEGLFGWEVETMTMSMGPYTVVKAGGIPAGGIMARVSDEIPPHWGFYVTVDNVDSIASKAEELGATIIVPAMDIPTVGRLCGIQDPQGAVVMVIQYEEKTDDAEMTPIEFSNYFKTHGAFSWVELRTPDLDGSVEFYSALFGWTIRIDQMGMGPYGMINVGDVHIGGMSAPMDENVPPHWGAYVTVDDADIAAEKAVASGGTVIVPPMDIPEVGRFTMIQDPQGAMLSAITYVAVIAEAG